MPFSLSVLIARLNDSRSVVHGVTAASLMSALTLVEPRRLSVGRRLAYRCAIAALTAWGVWAQLRTEDDGTFAPATRAGITIGAAGAALGIAEAGEAMDGRLSDGLVRAGARRPRMILAAASAVVSLGSWWWGTRQTIDASSGDFDEELIEEFVDVPDEVRALVSHFLAASEEFGAPELRAQLAEARASIYVGEDEDAFWPGIGFSVRADLPLAVPGDATFPVIGRYRALDSRTFDVYLVIAEGRIGTLAISESRDWTPEEMESWMDAGRGINELQRWPELSELELLIETPAGFRAL
ncbi:hypothetical protein ACWPKO_19890 (plasmid) [Coraliomargarita sp. W4R53]